MNKNFLSFIAIISFASSSLAQKPTKQEEAESIMKTAIEKMDNGEINESIELLEKAKKLDKKNNIYDYEIAYANYKKGEYSKSISILEKIILENNPHSEYYRLLGNSYDVSGNAEKALETYSKGIKLFPEKSGKFYSELGLTEYNRKNYDNAINAWEKGIKTDPYYSSNYYRLTKIFSLTEENIWTLFYGELFMNLEMNTQRTKEISELLYKTYQKTYVAKSETEGEYMLTKNNTTYIDSNEDITKSTGFNFELTYLAAYAVQVGYLKGVNIKSIYETKKGLISFWSDKEFEKIYPNKLIDLEKKMIADNVFEAYVYWLLSQGNEQEFHDWMDKNEDKFNAFASWVKENSIDLKETYKYSRPDYYQM